MNSQKIRSLTKVIISFIFSSNILLAQQIIDKGIFQVCYSEKKQQPLWLEYEVLCHTKIYSRRGLNFQKDKLFKGVTSDDADYYKNIWDKGHLAPSADFNCNYEKLKATFSYLNCALQHEKLNRGPWKELESYERKLSKKHKVDVRIELEFNDKSILLNTGALVASYFVKILHYNDKTRVFRFPNDKSVHTKEWKDYEITEPYIIIEGCNE